MADTIISRFENYLDRLQIMLNKLPGHETLFTNTKESNIQNMLFDLAVVYKFEDVGLELIKSLAEPDAGIHQRLILNKLLNIDFNISSCTKLDPISPSKRVLPLDKENIDDLVTLNIFDAVSSFKFLPSGNFNKVDDIIRHLFFPICIMGLAEFFYPLAIDEVIRSQLTSFMSKDQVCKMQKADIDGFKVVDLDTQANSNNLTTDKILTQLVEFSRTHKNLRKREKVEKTEIEGFGANLVELAKRLALSRGDPELRESLMVDVTGCDLWDIIKLLRIVIKKPYAIRSTNKAEVGRSIHRMMDTKDCSSVDLLKGALDGFMVVDCNNWVLNLAKSNTELSSSIRSDKNFWMYSLTKDGNLCLVNREQYLDLVFNVCVFELLSLFKIKNQNDLIKLELLSGLSSTEKKAIKFNKLYSIKSDEILLTFQYADFESDALEDYFYRKVLAILGNEKMANFFTIYQYYSLLLRNENSSKLIPALISQACSKANKKKSRAFFLLKEIDELIKEGQISKAYYRLKDQQDYCEEKSISSTKSNDVWMAMKESLLLLLASNLVPPKDLQSSDLYSYPNYMLLPSYYKEQLKSANWIIEKDGVYYIDDSIVNLEQTDEIAHNVRDKLHSILENEPKSLYQVSPDLQDYIEGIFSKNHQGILEFT